MNNNLEPKEISAQICNALECFNTATVKIELPVGSKFITILVCENCKLKFEN